MGWSLCFLLLSFFVAKFNTDPVPATFLAQELMVERPPEDMLERSERKKQEERQKLQAAAQAQKAIRAKKRIMPPYPGPIKTTALPAVQQTLSSQQINSFWEMIEASLLKHELILELQKRTLELQKRAAVVSASDKTEDQKDDAPARQAKPQNSEDKLELDQAQIQAQAQAQLQSQDQDQETKTEEVQQQLATVITCCCGSQYNCFTIQENPVKGFSNQNLCRRECMAQVGRPSTPCPKDISMCTPAVTKNIK